MWIGWKANIIISWINKCPIRRGYITCSCFYTLLLFFAFHLKNIDVLVMILVYCFLLVTLVLSINNFLLKASTRIWLTSPTVMKQWNSLTLPDDAQQEGWSHNKSQIQYQYTLWYRQHCWAYHYKLYGAHLMHSMALSSQVLTMETS